MTNQSPESVIAEVIEYHADTIGSHYDGCYKHHAVCLAVKLRDMLREPGGTSDPNRVTENSVRHVKRLTTELQNRRESLNDQRREYRKLLAKARAERDAATAAIGRVRALETFSITDSYPAWTAVDHDDLLAALAGAPEPEHNDSLNRASAWSDYRSEYGVHGTQSHRDFCAGWDAARGTLDIGGVQR